MKTDLKNLDQQGLINFVESLGQPAFRGRQLMAWLYRPGIKNFDEMTDLAKSFRKVLHQEAYISHFETDTLERSEDSSIKFEGIDGKFYFSENVIVRNLDILKIKNGKAKKIK